MNSPLFIYKAFHHAPSSLHFSVILFLIFIVRYTQKLPSHILLSVQFDSVKYIHIVGFPSLS